MQVRHETITFERRFRHPAARVYAALIDPDAREIWAPPSPDYNMTFTESDIRVGGREVCVCGPGEAEGVTVTSIYHALLPAQGLVFSESIGAPDEPATVSLVTVTLTEAAGETTLSATIQAADLSGGAMIDDMRGGWNASLDNLRRYLDAAVET